MKTPARRPPVSVIVPTRNVESTVTKALKSIEKQSYPIHEIIVVDNHSNDATVRLIDAYSNTSKIPIRLTRRRENKGIGASYNYGIKQATTDYVVLMHSDSVLQTRTELTKLITPLLTSPRVVASYPRVVVPIDIWAAYGFWQKVLMARSAGKSLPGFNGKFDAISRETLNTIGGFDEQYFSGVFGFGGEDADLAMRLRRAGDVVLSNAEVVHLHTLSPHYTFADLLANRKLLARTYGRVMRRHMFTLPRGSVMFLVKPCMVLLSFIPGLFGLVGVLFLIYAATYMPIMYTHPSANRDPRIILLPMVTVFFVYYEAFWMVEAFFFNQQPERQ